MDFAAAELNLLGWAKEYVDHQRAKMLAEKKLTNDTFSAPLAKAVARPIGTMAMFQARPIAKARPIAPYEVDPKCLQDIFGDVFFHLP